MNDRASFLGSTDAPCILGVSKWRTAVDVYLEKTGQLSQERQAAAARKEKRFARGRRLEPIIRDMTIEKLRDDGHEVELLGTNERFQDKRYPFLSSEIDFRLKLDGEQVNVDAKSVDRFAGDEWGQEGSEDVPIYYAAQFMQGLSLTPGAPRRCLVAALNGFEDVRFYWTVRDEETIEAMRERMVRFWKDHVLKRRPPDPVNFADLRNLFPVQKPKAIEVDDEIRARVENLRDLMKREKMIKEAAEHERFWIARYMGEHALLTDGVRDLMQFELESRSILDQASLRRKHPDLHALFVTESKTRVLRFAKARG